MYIPPNSDIQIYLNHFSVLESIESTFPNCKLIICGDYNIPSLSWANAKTGCECINFTSFLIKSSLVEICPLLNLCQFNNIINPSGNTLDLVFSNLFETTISHLKDLLVPIGPYHPAININIKFPIHKPVLVKLKPFLIII